MRTILQVPMDPQLKTEALHAAQNMGFSSLQELVRILLKKTASKQLSLTIEENFTPLSLDAEKRYLKINQNFKQNKNTHTAQNIKQLMTQLNAD